MRTTRPLALLSAAALAAASLAGGAGLASAAPGSLDSLSGGNGGSEDLVLTITDATTDDGTTTVTGRVENNTTESANCWIDVYYASIVDTAQGAYDADHGDWNPGGIGSLGWTVDDFPAGDTAGWDVDFDAQPAGFVPGAIAICTLAESPNNHYLFAYGPEYSAPGSLDLGSLDVGGSLGSLTDS